MKGSTVFVAGTILTLAIGHAFDACASAFEESSLNEVAVACHEDGPEAAANALLRIANENADGNPMRERILRALLLSGLSEELPECERRMREIYGK